MVNNIMLVFFLRLVIPEVSVIYSTIWAFANIIPHTCENISTHAGLILEETCQSVQEVNYSQISELYTFNVIVDCILFIKLFGTGFNKSRKSNSYFKKNFTIIDHCMSLFNVWFIEKFFTLKSQLTKIPIEGQIRLFINCYFVAEMNKIDYVSLVLIPGIKIITSICIMNMFICVIINLISANIIFI